MKRRKITLENIATDASHTCIKYYWYVKILRRVCLTDVLNFLCKNIENHLDLCHVFQNGMTFFLFHMVFGITSIVLKSTSVLTIQIIDSSKISLNWSLRKQLKTYVGPLL